MMKKPTTGAFTHMGLLIPPTPGGGHYPHFTDGKTEAQRREPALLRSAEPCLPQ